MELIAFSVSSTNIFPIANSRVGGQLLTEFNLRSRESVNTDPNVSYPIGASYTHSLSDFRLSKSTGDNYTFKIAPGRAVVNGHYLESLVSISIDMSDLNMQLISDNKTALTGDLTVGIRMIYSSEASLSGSLLPESNSTDSDTYASYYQGVHIVILPSSEFITPSDKVANTNQNAVTAHLKLGTISFNSSRGITSITNNDNKIQNVPAARISDIDQMLNDNYISASNLDPVRFYALTGKYGDSADSRIQDITGTLVVWDKQPTLLYSPQLDAPSSATFEPSKDKTKLMLRLPLKNNADHSMIDSFGRKVYYGCKDIDVPAANYNDGTPGIVNEAYTAAIKNIQNVVSNLRIGVLPTGGKFVKYLDSKTDTTSLPSLVNTHYPVGSYIIVGQDYTLGDYSSDVRHPSTLYIVGPAAVRTIDRWMESAGVQYQHASDVFDPPRRQTDSSVQEAISVGNSWIPSAAATSGGSLIASVSIEEFDPTKEDSVAKILAMLDVTSYNGRAGIDYFAVHGLYSNSITQSVAVSASGSAQNVKVSDEELQVALSQAPTASSTTSSGDMLVSQVVTYYYKVATIDPATYRWLGPVVLSQAIAPATSDAIGGFLSTEETGHGYVRITPDNRLQLVDYDLFTTVWNAYTLSTDITISESNTSDVFDTLFENVCNRVVRKDFTKADDGNTSEYSVPDHVSVVINLSDSMSVDSPIAVSNIDSGYGAYVNLVLTGSTPSGLQIFIENVEKLKLDASGLIGSPEIHVDNCGLFYDVATLNLLKSSSRNSVSALRLWYDKNISDTSLDIVVDGMTVTACSFTSPESTVSTDIYSQTTPDDNIYLYSLRTITFSSSGDVIGLGLCISDSTTPDASLPSESLLGYSFKVPQSLSLPYPARCFTRPLKISGTFLSAYSPNSSSSQIVLKENIFTAATNTYDITQPDVTSITGAIWIYAKLKKISGVGGNLAVNQIMNGLSVGSPNVFFGGSTGSTISQ